MKLPPSSTPCQATLPAMIISHFDALINWANALECRDDLEFKNEVIQELIFELANPEINGDATKERLQEIVNELQEQSPE